MPLPLVVLTVVVLVMALVSVWHSVSGGDTGGKVDLNKRLVFKCTKCGHVGHYTLKEVREMMRTAAPEGRRSPMMPMMGLPVLQCPKCKEMTFETAIECPNCGEIFIAKPDPKTGRFDDTCPKCGTSASEHFMRQQRGKSKKK